MRQLFVAEAVEHELRCWRIPSDWPPPGRLLPGTPAIRVAAQFSRQVSSILRRLVVCALAAFGVPGGAAPSAVTVEPANVLVLYSNGRLIPANVEGDRGLHQTLHASPDRPVALHYEFLDTPRFSGPDYEAVVTAYLRGKYTVAPPRVIVAVSEQALEFLLRHRDEVFPGIPVVHVGATDELLSGLSPLPPDVVGVPVDYSFAPTVALAMRLHPRARRLVVVTGASAPDRVREAQLRDELVAFANRVEVEALRGLPTSQLLPILGQLGSDTVVVTPGYFQDGDGRSFMPFASVQAMADASTAPVYGTFDTFIGTGIVGGSMPSFEEMGRQAGRIVNDILTGADPVSLPLPGAMPQTIHLDWRELQRWGVDTRSIPPDAVVHFKPPTLLEAHRTEAIVAALVFALQAGLIGWLLAERRRRHLAEQAEASQRRELAHASRLAIAGELTGSIAHEINQPLGAILSNADAAELILGSDEDRRDELRGILADIRRDDLRACEVIRRLRSLLAKHELQRLPFDLNETVREIEPVLRAELRRRRVSFEIRTTATPITIVGDPIETQQVLINLVLNAMDAMADVPESQRAIVVSLSVGDDTAAVEVRDSGHGISPENLPKLFDPFFTTKGGGMGLGLSIARTMVEAHGGRIRADNASRGGAVFRVELPVAGAREGGPGSRDESEAIDSRRR